jgi:CubicO group peptidase (beta-lactamase class C family)
MAAGPSSLTAATVIAAALFVCAGTVASCAPPRRPVTALSPNLASTSCFGSGFSQRVMHGIAGYADVVDIPGISIGIVSADSLVYAAAHGYADRSSKTLATPDTAFNIGSLTKVFTATLALMMTEEGALDLDAPVSRYLPASVHVPDDSAGRAITSRQLLSHTSGLPRDPPNRRNLKVDGPVDPGIWEAYNISDLYSALAVTKLSGGTGQQHLYSNYGYALLGHVLERIAARPYETVLRERVLGPLNMKQTSITLRPEQQQKLAAFYWSEDVKRVEQRVHASYGEVAGFIGLTSTVTDLAKLVGAHFGGTRNPVNPVTRGVAESMAQPQFLLMADPLGHDDVGLGWFRMELVDETPHKVILLHTGDVDGHSSGLYLLPREKIGVIVLQNLGGLDGGRGIEQFGFWLLRLSSQELSRCSAT